MNFKTILGEHNIAANGLELQYIIFQVCKDKLSSRGRLGGVKVLMHFNIHVVNKPGSPTLTLRSSRQEVYTQDVGKVYFLSRVHLEQLHMLVSNIP